MTVKVTLSIPDDLAERIDRHRDRVNQSAIFAEAMRRELAILELRDELGDLTATLARVRPQYDDYEKEPYRIGYRAGLTWARDRATYPQLKRLAEEYRDSDDPAWLGRVARTDPDHFGIAGLEPMRQQAIFDAGHAEWAENLRQPGGSDRMRSEIIDSLSRRVSFSEPQYDKGWAEGVMRVWNAIKDKL